MKDLFKDYEQVYLDLQFTINFDSDEEVRNYLYNYCQNEMGFEMDEYCLEDEDFNFVKFYGDGDYSFLNKVNELGQKLKDEKDYDLSLQDEFTQLGEGYLRDLDTLPIYFNLNLTKK